MLGLLFFAPVTCIAQTSVWGGTGTVKKTATDKAANTKTKLKDINIIIYPSVDQLYESNIGGWESQQFTFPTFVYKGTRIVLGYNGTYANLKDQLDEGLARALWEAQMKDGDKADPAKDKTTKKKGNSKTDGIPYWYKEGSIRYFAHGWTIAAEDQFRTSFEQNNYSSFQQVLSYEQRLAGQAFCYFLTQQYFPKVVAQAFFQVKKKKSLTRGIRLVTKHGLDTLYQQCFAFYQQRFKIDTAQHITIKEGINFHHKKGTVSNVLINPTKDYIAYILLAHGNRNVYLYDIKNEVTKKITSYQLPPWIDDHSRDQYPLLQWHPDGKQLYVAKPRKGKLTISRYTPDGENLENTILKGVDGIIGFQPLSEREFLLAAYIKGQSDIVSFNNNHEKFTPYTDDEYDDSYPWLTGKGKEILFVSDRPEKFSTRKTYLIGVGYKKDTLRQGIYTLTDTILQPVAIDSVSYIKWDKLLLLNESEALATSTKYGMERNVLLNYQYGKMTELTSYQPYQYLRSTHEMSFFSADKDSVYTTQMPFTEWVKNNKASASDTSSPWLTDYYKMLALQAKEDSILKHAKDTTHYFMEDVFKSAKDSAKSKKKKPEKKQIITKNNGDPNVEPYILQLHSAYFTAQVNNDYFINRYQPYLNYQGAFKFPELGGITKGGFADLLENHHFTIAYKLPAATQGSDFFIRYENTEKKVDWGLSYFRKVETLQPDPNRNWVDENGNKYPDNAKAKTHNYEFFIKYPLTYYCYLGFQTAMRQDETIFLATDKYSLDFLPIKSAWSINTFSYNLNKLQPTIPNLFKGFKAEAFIDLFKGFSQSEAFVFAASTNMSYHQPIYKYITLVTQFHAGYSGGDEKILYNMGGVDNNVTPRVDTSVHFAQSAPYAFQTLVTPFRGYYQNSLYGNMFFLTNFDLYFPLFQTLVPIETPLPFINNLQLGTFTDLGTAKEKWYNHTANGGWLSSYGISARTTLAGYPLRLDLAWPGTFRKAPVLYFSLKL